MIVIVIERAGVPAAGGGELYKARRVKIMLMMGVDAVRGVAENVKREGGAGKESKQRGEHTGANRLLPQTLEHN